MEIEEEFISGFCRTMKLTFMDCAHERCVNTGACEIFKQAHELEQK